MPNENTKRIIIDILRILEEYSDENHTLTQKDVIDLLYKEHNIAVDRKTVKRNLEKLIEMGYSIECDPATKTVKTKDGSEETTEILTDFYLERDFTEGEIRLIIDSLLFSRHIPYGDRNRLIEKVEGLTSKYFKSRVSHISTVTENLPGNKALFYNVEILDEAISQNKKVSFNYEKYGTDKKPHLRTHESTGEAIEYIINPYQMVTANGRYYLICNLDKYSDLSNYRVDKIKNIKILDESRKPLKEVKGGEHGLNLPKHMAEHIYMFGGESIRAEFVTDKWMTDEILDWFGQDVTFRTLDENRISVSVRVNEKAMEKWAIQYAPYVTVISPERLVASVKSALEKALENYKSP